MLDRMAWDRGIDGFLYVGTMQRSGIIKWRIWDPGIFFCDSGDQQLEIMLVQELLEDKKIFCREDSNIPNFDFSFNRINKVYWGSAKHSTILYSRHWRHFWYMGLRRNRKIQPYWNVGATPQGIRTPWRKNRLCGKEFEIFG